MTKCNPHQLRLARLEWELTQRKQLASLCDELTESKKAVATSIDTKQTRLDNLAPKLHSILEVSFIKTCALDAFSQTFYMYVQRTRSFPGEQTFAREPRIAIGQNPSRA